MAFSFAKRWWQPKSLRPILRRSRSSCLSLERLEDRLVPSLAINPIFDGSITNDPNAATIERTINTAIQNVESSFSNPITVTIEFQEGTSGLGSSSTPYVAEVSYASFRANLAAAATSPYATAAVASLPTGIVNPVNGNADMYLTDPEARALGYSGAIPPTGPDGIITLNTSICNLSRSSIDPTKYDLQAVTSHEIDEVLGFSSALNGSSNGAPAPTGPVRADDLWRYDQNGARSFNTSAATQAYFSIDGGQTHLAQFNQNENGDFSDWYSPGGQKPQVQDAFGTPGATPNLGVELIRLNVDGYTPAPLAAPAGLTATPVSSSQINLSWNNVPGATGYTLEWSTDGQNWNALPGTSATSYSDTGLQAGTTYYFRVQASNALGSSPYSVPVSATTLSAAPPTPAGLTATTNGPTQITLSWNSASGATGYTLERSLVNDPNTADSNWQVIAANLSGTGFVDTGLQAGTTYYYSVSANNAAGSSPWSAPANATTTPSAPMGLTATPVPPSQINLSWNAVSGASGGYVIERSSNGSSGWTPIGTTAAGVTTFNDTGLAPNTTYYYEVGAVDAGGDSPFSAIVSASTALATPTLRAAGSGSSVNLYWNSVSGASNYTVQRSTDGQSWSVLTTLGSNSVGYSDTGLPAGATYYYRVQATDAAESSSWSAPASGTTAPPAPTGLTATAVSSSEIDLSWNSAPGATGYALEWSTDDSTWFGLSSPSGTSYSDTGRPAGATYYFRIAAINAAGYSSYSNPVSATTLLNAPTGLTPTAVANYQITLSWNGDPGATGYTLERSTDDLNWSVLTNTSSTAYTDTGLTAGATYYYRIQASNAVESSPWSAAVGLTTTAVLPNTPSIMEAIADSSNEIYLYSIGGGGSNALHYILQRSTDDQNWGTIAVLNTGGGYDDTGLQAGTTYYYRVAAGNTVGTSPWSSVVSSTTYPATPTLRAATGSTATSLTNAQINLSWNSVAGATGYELQGSTDGRNWQYPEVILDTISSGTSFTDTGASWNTPIYSDTTYYYRIRALGSGAGAWSAPVSAVSSMTQDEHWVMGLYLNICGRPSSSDVSKAELDGWVRQIPSQGYGGIALAVERSTEALDRVVNGIYEDFLGRAADPTGESHWVAQIQQYGATEEQVMAQILASPEFWQHNGSNAYGFVAALYIDVLHRPASQPELQGWVNSMASGASPAQVASVFVTCSEFRTDALEALYDGAVKGVTYDFIPNLLRRSPDSAGLNSWINYWNGSGTDLMHIEAAFASSSEFYQDCQNN